MSRRHKLTKDDIRILRFAADEYIRCSMEGTSGDLFAEAREQLRRAKRHLPKIKDLPPGDPLPCPFVLLDREAREFHREHAG